MQLLTLMHSVLINRRIGGLEKSPPHTMVRPYINRRIGGLETTYQGRPIILPINRRIGGLETEQIF